MRDRGRLATAAALVALAGRTDRESTPAALFAGARTRSFRLRRGSPALDRGQVVPGESKTDVDGQPRTLGTASDLGADELDTVAPQVTITRPGAGRTLPAGRYRVRVSGTDRAGVDGNAAPARRRSVTFRVRGAAGAP